MMGVVTAALYPVPTDALAFHNVMLGDALGSMVAVVVFAAVLYAPGYLFGYATDVFGFRRMGFVDASTWAVACSFCVSPIAAYLLGKIAGLRGIGWMFCLAVLGTLTLLLSKRSHLRCSPRELRLLALFFCGWTLFALLMLADVQVGHKLYFSVVTADESYRIAFTDAVARTGVPPANPLYFAGVPAPMPYYYFWYVLCAAVVTLGHVSARQAFIASTVWAGFGLLATTRLYTLHFFRWERRRRWLALGLLLVTGADLLPALGNAILQPSLNGDTEWWSVDPIDAWPDSLLWVPHHVAGVLCCLLGFLFLWRMAESSARSGAWPVLALTALAFASGFGLSVYVAFGFALLMLAWLVRLWVLRQAQRRAWLGRLAMAAAFSALLLAPFLRELAVGLPHTPGGQRDASPPTSHLFSFSVRRMIDSGLLTGLPVLRGWNQAHPVLLDQTIRLLLLVPGLALELGLYGAVLVLLLWTKRRKGWPPPHEARDTALFFSCIGLLTTMFLTSAVITNNDFGYRAVMLPQFFLLLLTAELLGSWQLPDRAQQVLPATTGKVRLLYGLLAMGVAGSVYWAFLLRAWLPLEARAKGNTFQSFRNTPDEAFQIREAFHAVRRNAPPEAVVAFRPIDREPDRGDAVMTPNEFYQRLLVMNTGRQMLNAERQCATHFGGDPNACPAIQSAMKQLYALPAPSAGWAQAFCGRFGVGYLTISTHDPDWDARTGWPVTLPGVAEEPGIRVVRCDATR